MTEPLPERPSKRGWSRPGRAPLRQDLLTGLTLFLVEMYGYAYQAVRFGMAGWAGGPAAEIDAAQRAGIAWTGYLLIAALVLAGLAALFRAPWTAVSQVLIAGALAVLLGMNQHGYDLEHPVPTPRPSVLYSPCYSGSGTCH